MAISEPPADLTTVLSKGYLVLPPIPDEPDREPSPARIKVHRADIFDTCGIARLLRDVDARSYSLARAAGQDAHLSIRVCSDGVYVGCNDDDAMQELSDSASGGSKDDPATPATASTQEPGTPRVLYEFYPFPDWPPSEDAALGSARGAYLLEKLQVMDGTELLFLANVCSSKVTVVDRLGREVWSRTARLEGNSSGSKLTQLRVRNVKAGVTVPPELTETRQFLVSNYPIPDALRSKEGRAGKRTASHEYITLAFPVPAADARQYLYGFVPIRRGPFNFLVHVDIWPGPGGRDTTGDKAKDVTLRAEIAGCIARRFEHLPTDLAEVRYTLTRYLSPKVSLAADESWCHMPGTLAAVVQRHPLLHARIGDPQTLYHAGYLRILCKDQIDSHGDPLFPDLAEEPLYLSDKYKREDLDVLGGYGLEEVCTEDLLPRLRAFVQSTAWDAKFHGVRDEDWHSRAARWILQAWNDGRWKEELGSMALLPLRSGNFCSPAAAGQKVYFPDTDGIPIPQDLPLAVLHPAAVSNQACRELYEALGVVTAGPELVKSLIDVKSAIWYSNPGLTATPSDVSMSNGHLRYLYATHPRLMPSAKSSKSSPSYKTVVVFDHRGKAVNPREVTVYLPTPGEWSLEKRLLRLRDEDGYDQVEAGVSFLHPTYLQDPPPVPPGDPKATWANFLCRVVHLHEEIRMFNGPDDRNVDLTPEWRFIIQHRPEWLLSRLHMSFSHRTRRREWILRKFGTDVVRNVVVTCSNGTRWPLRKTILPLPSLLSRCSTWLSGAPEDALPFLRLEASLTDADGDENTAWATLARHFGICAADDLTFAFAALTALMHEDAAPKQTLTQVVVSIYLKIFEQCRSVAFGDEEREAVISHVRSWFSDNPGVLYTPQPAKPGDADGSSAPEWGFPEGCRWTADPESTLPRQCIFQDTWGHVLESLDAEDGWNLKSFFSDVLRILDVSTDQVEDKLHMLAAGTVSVTATKPTTPAKFSVQRPPPPRGTDQVIASAGPELGRDIGAPLPLLFGHLDVTDSSWSGGSTLRPLTPTTSGSSEPQCASSPNQEGRNGPQPAAIQFDFGKTVTSFGGFGVPS